jgi:hypothetical protein
MRIRPTLGLLAEASLAEMGTAEDRTRLLRAIAEGNRQGPADGLLTAIAVRLVDRIGTGDPQRDEAITLLREERQRAQTRSFAGDYDGFLKSDLRFRGRRRLVVVALGVARTRTGDAEARPGVARVARAEDAAGPDPHVRRDAGHGPRPRPDGQAAEFGSIIAARVGAN